jgi:hypothetical protein
LQVLEGGFADETVVTDALDVEQPSVGRKADLAQFREIFNAPADSKVAGVIDGGFGAKRLSLEPIAKLGWRGELLGFEG